MIRKEFTALSAFSVIAACAAGAVLCAQFSQTELQLGMAASGPVLWAVEAVVFGTAIFIWYPRVSFVGWLLGIVGLMTVRVALVSAAGVVIVYAHRVPNAGAALEQAQRLVPRACAVLFSLMACYPLRVFLPLREARSVGKRRSFADSAAVKSAAAGGGEGDGGLLIVTVKGRGSDESQLQPPIPPHRGPGMVPQLNVEGEVELPASSILALLPDELVTDKALAIGEAQTVTIPLHIVHPQLREGQVLFTASELRGMLPPAVRKALAQPGDSGPEVENMPVSLPLEHIVPQLPAEALELPPPAPPAWAEVDESQKIVFATT